MKRSFVALILVAAISFLVLAVDDAIIIASWNVQNLYDSKCISCLANVIQGFDIVALQEVKSLGALHDLEDTLNRLDQSAEWKAIESPLIGDGNAAEHYAFIFRQDRVQFVCESDDVYMELSPSDFSREPFYASFRAGAFDFTLVTVHITWGDSAVLRIAECGRLVDVWESVQEMDPDEDDVILLGDFNRDKPTHSAFGPIRSLGLVPLLTSSGTRTTFGQTPSDGSWYDNIWTNPSKTTTLERTGFVGSGTLSRNTLRGGCPEYLRGVSDHCPVWAEFSTLYDDDPSCGELRLGNSGKKLAGIQE